MSDEGNRTINSSSRSKNQQSSGGNVARTYAGGGAAGQRKADNPAAWSRTPSSRAGSDRKLRW